MSQQCVRALRLQDTCAGEHPNADDINERLRNTSVAFALGRMKIDIPHNTLATRRKSMVGFHVPAPVSAFGSARPLARRA